MKNKSLLLIAFLSVQIAVCQDKTTVDGFTIEVKKTKSNPTPFQAVSYKLNASDAYNKLMVRCRVKSISEEFKMFDPNKFYMLVDNKKIRVKPFDARYNHMLHEFLPFGYLSFEKTENNLVSYKPEIKDSFDSFPQDGYKDVKHKINIGSVEKPEKILVYFNHQPLKSNLVDIYFAVQKEVKNVKIYYGNQLLEQTTIK